MKLKNILKFGTYLAKDVFRNWFSCFFQGFCGGKLAAQCDHIVLTTNTWASPPSRPVRIQAVKPRPLFLFLMRRLCNAADLMTACFFFRPREMMLEIYTAILIQMRLSCVESTHQDHLCQLRIFTFHFTNSTQSNVLSLDCMVPFAPIFLLNLLKTIFLI